MKHPVPQTFQNAAIRILRTSIGRLVLMAACAACLASSAFASLFISGCIGPFGQNYTTVTYCNDPSYQCLAWADTTCTCNDYGNCWVQNWQCSGCGS
jgi:hypothetical protein